MRFIIPEIEVGEYEGFTRENDIFQRGELANGLTNLLSNAADPIVLAIDGKWGTGKTVFLKMWAGELRKKRFPIVYFDAFENDYLEDAFMAIAGQIFSLIEEKQVQKKSRAKKYLDRATQVGKVLMRSGLKIGIKAATLGAISAADQEEVASDVAKAATKDLSSEIGTLFDEYVGEMIMGQKEQQKSITQFRDALSQLPEVLQSIDDPKPTADDTRLRPLVFFIDELDRCRPPFALEVLERIKHFFNVPNVHFVLGCNTDQLLGAVASVYGSKIDGLSYLRKFIHINVPVQQRNYDHLRLDEEQYVNHLREELGISSELGVELTSTIAAIAPRLQLDLRTIERIMTVAALSLAFSPDIDKDLTEFLAGLCVLKVTAPQLYRDIKNGSCDYPSVDAALKLQAGDEEDENHRLVWMRRCWKYVLNDSIDDEERREMKNFFSRHSRDNPKKLLEEIANRVFDRFAAN